MKLKNKKGFTLAELLIVIAIIAVLTAIAVPLFTSSLNKAEKATFDSNRDATRAAGMVVLLNQEEFGNGPWFVKATFENNEIKTVKVFEEGATGDDVPKAETKFEDWKGTKTEIVVKITETDLNDSTYTKKTA